MAIGDQDDVVSRLQALMPSGWFPLGLTPFRDAVLAGFANALAFVYSLLAYIRLQTRIATATDGFLDLIAFDFFGTALLRQANEGDAAFRARILTNLLRERATRRAITIALTQLTGRVPIIIEPMQPQDTGAYSTAGSGYGQAGYYGSRVLPFEMFVIAFRPHQNGVPGVGGYKSTVGGYGVGSIEYISQSMVQNAVTDASIYAAVNSVRPVATRIWVCIEN